MFNMSVIKDKYSRAVFYLQNLSLYILSPLLIAAINIFINPFIAANLSHTDYAIIGYFSSFSILFTPLISFNLISYYTRNYFRINEDARIASYHTIIISLLVIGLFTSVLVTGGFYVFCKINNVSFPFLPFAAYTIAQVYFANFVNLTQVQHRMKREAKKFFRLSMTNALLAAVFSIFFVIVLKGGSNGKLAATFLSAFLVGAFCVKSQLKKFEFNKSILIAALKFSWPITISATLWFFLSGVDRTFLEKLKDNYNLGLYNVGLQITGYLAFIYTALSQTFEPDLYKAIADRNKGRLVKIIGGIQFLNAIPVVIFLLFAKPIIHLLTKGYYDNAADYAQILVLKNITIAVFYSANIVIVGSGFTKVELTIRATSAFISFFLFKYLIEYYGYYGAAWCQVLVFLVMAIFSIGYIIFKFKKHL